jgi:hypothetical protein
MKIIGTIILLAGLGIWLCARLIKRSGVKSAKKSLAANTAFVGYDQLTSTEKKIYSAIHSMRCNADIWRGNQWQMIAWNTVCGGDCESFRELCKQLISEGQRAPDDMMRIVGKEVWGLLLQYRENFQYTIRDDCGGYPDAFEANLGHQL